MLHKFLEPGPWFRAKSYGLGAGLPIRWQGWALLAAHVATIAGIALAFADRPAILITMVLLTTFLPLPIYAARTEGGWRWRWGGR